MKLERPIVPKRLLADGARVGLHSRVNTSVGGQRTRLGEAPVAVLAHKRLLPRVDAFVSAQRAGLGEGPTTNVTLERLVSSVCPNMLLEVTRLSERLATILARERFVSCVRAHVRLQPTRTVKRFPTLFAWVPTRIVLPLPLDHRSLDDLRRIHRGRDLEPRATGHSGC